MRSVNQVILIGNLTRDPEIRQTMNGQKIVTFGLATNREWNGPDGKKSLAEYHNVVAFGTLAELCTKLLSKGCLVYIQGYLKTRSWDHESGVKVFRTEIVANDMICFDRKGQQKGAEEAAAEETVHEGFSEAASTFDDDDFFAEMPSEPQGGQEKNDL